MENRISTLASKQEKKDQVVQLSENEFSDAAENMCSVYRKLMCTESWISDGREHHWIEQCVLTKALKTFPGNFQDQDRKKQDERNIGQKKYQKNNSKNKN